MLVTWSGYQIFREKYFLHDCADCYREEGDSVLLRNVGTYVPNYTKSQLRQP